MCNCWYRSQINECNHAIATHCVYSHLDVQAISDLYLSMKFFSVLLLRLRHLFVFCFFHQVREPQNYQISPSRGNLLDRPSSNHNERVEKFLHSPCTHAVDRQTIEGYTLLKK